MWELVELFNGFRPIGCKWMFNTKKNSKEKVKYSKARLVAKGFIQKEGINYKKTFLPISFKDSFKIIMAMVAYYDLKLYQIDVKIGLLVGDLYE